MTSTNQLLKATIAIWTKTGKTVTAIQFEDGSGFKFNVQFNGSSKWEFIEITSEDTDNLRVDW